MKKGSVIGIGIGDYGIGYRRYSKESIGIGIGIGHHGIVPSLINTSLTILLFAIYLIINPMVFQIDLR